MKTKNIEYDTSKIQWEPLQAPIDLPITSYTFVHNGQEQNKCPVMVIDLVPAVFVTYPSLKLERRNDLVHVNEPCKIALNKFRFL